MKYLPLWLFLLLASCSGPANNAGNRPFTTDTPAIAETPGGEAAADTMRHVPAYAKDSMMQQAERMNSCMISGQYEQFASYMPPQVLARLGGMEKVALNLQLDREAMKKQGEDYVGITLGKPSELILHEGLLQATLPYVLRVGNSRGTMLDMHSGLIGISRDRGYSWCFIDASVMKSDPNTLKIYLPELSDNLKLPEIRNEVVGKQK